MIVSGLLTTFCRVFVVCERYSMTDGCFVAGAKSHYKIWYIGVIGIDCDNCSALISCLMHVSLFLFDILDNCNQELREKQVRQQAVLDDLYRVREEKVRELQRHREEERERRRREEEEAAR